MLRKFVLLMPNMLAATMFLVVLSKTETPAPSLPKEKQLLLLSSVQAHIITDMAGNFRPVSVRMALTVKDTAHNAAGITTAKLAMLARPSNRWMAKVS
nr:MAG TPA: hypothetical protein [Caudoviricetes sp.]